MITSRLLPGIKVGDATISIEYDASIEYDGSGDDGRVRYRYYIDLPKWEHNSNDLTGRGGLQEGLSSLLSFLSAFAEAVRYRESTGRYSENADLFPDRLEAWAVENSDELSMLSCELEETPHLIQEGTNNASI
jgi:hypothetical protein